MDQMLQRPKTFVKADDWESRLFVNSTLDPYVDLGVNYTTYLKRVEAWSPVLPLKSDSLWLNILWSDEASERESTPPHPWLWQYASLLNDVLVGLLCGSRCMYIDIYHFRCISSKLIYTLGDLLLKT